MSGNFYTVLLFSLLLTVGAFLIYYGYRYFIAMYGGKPTSNKYVTVHNLENGEAKGEIIFFINVAEKMNVKMDILDLNDQLVTSIENKEFEEGDHRIKFLSTTIPNGDYFYSIVTDHQNTIKKFKVNND